MAEIRENKFQYYLRVFKGASFDRFFKAVDKAHDKSGKSKLSCMIDILYSMKRFGAGYNDYCDFEFWTLSKKQRDEVILYLYQQGASYKQIVRLTGVSYGIVARVITDRLKLKIENIDGVNRTLTPGKSKK